MKGKEAEKEDEGRRESGLQGRWRVKVYVHIRKTGQKGNRKRKRNR
jgi:hypothetical protein